MEPTLDPPSQGPRHDLAFVLFPDHFEVWFGDRIALDRPDLVDECAEWLEDQFGAVNLGQIDHQTLLADGSLTPDLRSGITGWWEARIPDLAVGPDSQP